MLLAVATSFFFATLDLHLPVPAAVEELIVVGLLLLLELSFNSRRQTSNKKQGCLVDRKIKEDDLVTGLLGRLQVAAKAGDTDVAEAAMEKILATGTKPSLVCYGSLISAFAKAGHVKRAEHWLEV